MWTHPNPLSPNELEHIYSTPRENRTKMEKGGLDQGKCRAQGKTDARASEKRLPAFCGNESSVTGGRQTKMP